MKPTDILWPVLAQMALTVVVLVLMGPARARSMSERRQSMGDADVRLGTNTWSETAIKVANNYKNQFELPVIFYALVLFALQTSSVDRIMLALAWIFALSRIVHTAIHIGPNVIMWRGAAFLVGAAALVAMGVKLALALV